MGTDRADLENPEEMIKVGVELSSSGDRPLVQLPVGCENSQGQNILESVQLPLRNEGVGSSLNEEQREAADRSPLHEDALGLRQPDLHENGSNFEIERLQHENPRFIDFRKMPVPIIQCFFWPDKWKVLVVCAFLNCTRRKQVEQIVWKFFEKYPTPEALLEAPDEEVQELIRPLGFYKRRTKSLKNLSEDFVSKNWKSPEDLRSVGVYAATCYRMMFEFELGTHAPDDHALVDLYHWMRQEFKFKLGRTLPNVLR